MKHVWTRTRSVRGETPQWVAENPAGKIPRRGLKMDGKSAKVELARVLGKMQVMAYSFFQEREMILNGCAKGIREIGGNAYKSLK